jgi:hypothetical protein
MKITLASPPSTPHRNHAQRFATSPQSHRSVSRSPQHPCRVTTVIVQDFSETPDSPVTPEPPRKKRKKGHLSDADIYKLKKLDEEVFGLNFTDHVNTLLTPM